MNLTELTELKIIWKGPVMNPTGISTAGRETVKALDNLGVKVQCADIFTDEFPDAKGMEKFNKPINAVGACTVFDTYPTEYDGGYGKRIARVVHEGTRIPVQWTPIINKMHKVAVPSNATRNLLRWNGVQVPIKVIPYGVNELYYPDNSENVKSEFVFLSVNSWTGELDDRKGTDILVKAFHEEFKNEPNVKLWVKVSTFWQVRPKDYYAKQILKIVGEQTDQILVNEDYLPEDRIADLYRMADCFVSPTKGEAFGMTILNAMASGLPVVVTKDRNAGHLDFCPKGAVVWINPSGMAQADKRFFVEGNMQPVIELGEVRRALREAYDKKVELRKLARSKAKELSEEYSWLNTARDTVNYIMEESKW